MADLIGVTDFDGFPLFLVDIFVGVFESLRRVGVRLGGVVSAFVVNAAREERVVIACGVVARALFLVSCPIIIY